MKKLFSIVSRQLKPERWALMAAVAAATVRAEVNPARPEIATRQFDVTTYGAKGDGAGPETTALQAAIDAAAAAGGGVVEFPKGVYLSGPLELASGIDLQLDGGAVLRMLPLDLYPGGTRSPKELIGGHGLHDVAITGSGTIDGQGTPWWPFARVAGARRPRMIALSGCQRVLISGVTLMNSPMFHIAISGGSTDVTVIGVKIRANASTDPIHPGHNTDACDVSGHRVLVRDCDVSVGDDDFTCGGGTSDVLITHNTYGNGHGVSIGSPIVGGVQNLTVEDCTFTGTDSGIRIKSDRDRGGYVRHLMYRNLKMTDVACPILIYGTYNAKDPRYRRLDRLTPEIAATYPAKPVGPRTPRYEDISFINITAVARAGTRAGLIWGLPEAHAAHILLQNVTITADLPFGVFDADDIRLVDSTFVTPDGVKPLVTYQAQLN